MTVWLVAKTGKVTLFFQELGERQEGGEYIVEGSVKIFNTDA